MMAGTEVMSAKVVSGGGPDSGCILKIELTYHGNRMSIG